ncbi:MAG: Glycosyl transferase group 1 [Parcubacteria group bacterium GW2011_GWA2_44_12]|nr:MAG: Glycosyl transferase group 1 [Parcubacteria group bacterium GW2011_GWA2_44_12]
MKRIGVDIRILAQEQWTGIAHYTCRLLHAVLAKDRENEYILFYSAAQKKLRRKIPRFSGVKPVQYVGLKLPNRLLNASFSLLNFPHLDELIAPSHAALDVFWSPNINFLTLSKNPRLLKILTVYDLSFEIFPEFFSLRQNAWYKAVRAKMLCEKFDKIITVSHNSRDDLIEKYGVSKEKIKVIYPGADDQTPLLKNPSLPETVRKKYRLPQTFVLSLGTLEPRKNTLALIEAIERINEHIPEPLHLVLAGKIGAKGNPLESSQNNDKIHSIGYVDERDKHALYQMASCFVFPSMYEGFGMPVLEAMQAGVPVITSSHSSLKEVARSAALLVNPYNLEELSSALLAMLSSARLREHFIRKGRERASDFSWAQATSELLKLFAL